MKFKAYAQMKSCPGFDLVTKFDPLDFETTIGGAFQARLGPFSADISEIPIRMTIPFMKRCHSPVIASIGGIKLGLDSFNLSVDKVAMNLKGVVGKDGIKANMHAKVDCETTMEVDGIASGRIGLSHLDLGGDDELPDHPTQACCDNKDKEDKHGK